MRRIKNTLRIAIGGKAGMACWATSIAITTATAFCCGPNGIALGLVASKLSYIPYVYCIRRAAKRV